MVANIKINWIIDIPGYEVKPEFKDYLIKLLEELKEFLKVSSLDLILIPFGRSPGFEKTLEKHKNYFSNPNIIKTLQYIEDGFALCVQSSVLRDIDSYLIVVKVFKFMKISVTHELLHKAFELNTFKKRYLPRSYFREGENFTWYLEEFFVEYLANNRNKSEIIECKPTLKEYLDLNELTEKSLYDKSLNIFKGFTTHGGNDQKTLLISLLSCYYILFASWRMVKENKPELEVYFKELWNKILNFKELEFFKKSLNDMMKIFLEEDIVQITDKMQILFNNL